MSQDLAKCYSRPLPHHVLITCFHILLSLFSNLLQLVPHFLLSLKLGCNQYLSFPIDEAHLRHIWRGELVK